MQNFYDYYRAKTKDCPQHWVFGELRQRFIRRHGYEYFLWNNNGEILIDETTACAYLGESDRDGTPMFEHDVILWECCSDDPLVNPVKMYWLGNLRELLKYKDRIKEGKIIGNTFDDPCII